MARYGGSRDVSLFRRLNRELMADIITQQCAFYKPNIAATQTNMYGESAGDKYYIGPVLFNCLIDRKDVSTNSPSSIIDTNEKIDFMLLRDDLVDGNYLPEIGDVILYEEGYYEIHELIQNQYHSGKSPDYPNSENPLNPGLENYGYDVSIICQTHLIDSDLPGITPNRIM